MKINRLFSLELERNSLRPYQIAVEVGTVFILGFIYLMAAIPKLIQGIAMQNYLVLTIL